MCHTLRFAFTAAQAVLDFVVEVTEFAILEYDSFLLDQSK